MAGHERDGRRVGIGDDDAELPDARVRLRARPFGYSIWDIDQLSGKRYSPGTARVSLAGVGVLRVPAMAVNELRTAASPSAQSADAAQDASYQAQAPDRPGHLP